MKNCARFMLCLSTFCLLILYVASVPHTFSCQNIIQVTNADGTTSRRCSGWVRLSISDIKQQNNENSKNKPTDPNNKENEGSRPTGSTNTQENTPNKNNSNHSGPQSVAIIDVPINCPEGFRPDPRGICRESF
ncbi:uncharacterized protein LOC113386956 [Ctenocephalides felis]|uniref:uncharacterized protein LOC113386956 n=1 Tax=Ctenocephalides felis TaxID=7515 RepID=UPI000E6E2B0B|nr:uncharacterized protein LOC113386956 [Ctenocephalides felis]